MSTPTQPQHRIFISHSHIDNEFGTGKRIIPLLHRECSVRADLHTLQGISFLSPKTYETAFKEVRSTLFSNCHLMMFPVYAVI